MVREAHGICIAAGCTILRGVDRETESTSGRVYEAPSLVVVRETLSEGRGRHGAGKLRNVSLALFGVSFVSSSFVFVYRRD